MLKVYEYPSCTTCRRAKKFLKDNNLDAEFINIQDVVPSKDELKKVLGRMNLKRLFNTSGKSYRNMNLKDNFQNLNTEEALDLLISDSMLIKRPLLIDDENENYLIGFHVDEWERLL